jgi:hypothetical protein
MAKNYKNPDVAELLKSAEQRPDSVEWITSRGIHVTLKSIPPYLVSLAAQSVERPEVPTYTAKIAGGGEEIHFHDEVSIVQSSEAEKAEWALYKLALAEADQKANNIILDIILLEGVDIDVKDEELLIKKLKVFNINIPDDPTERMLVIRRAYLIGCEEDATTISSLVMALTGVRIKDLNAVKSSFPDKMESDS